jgi:hypothetical protein
MARQERPGPVTFRLPLGQRLLSLIVLVMLGGVSAIMTAFAAVLLAVTLDDQSLRLDLPAGRSLIHRPPACHATIPYGDIEAVETRLEAYGTLGMAMMQRAYVLRGGGGGGGGGLIFLFEDRAIGTPLETPLFRKIATEIAARAGVPLRDLGMVEGDGGLLAVWGTQAPDWAAPSLPIARQFRIWRHVAATGTLAIVVVVVALVVRLLSGPI